MDAESCGGIKNQQVEPSHGRANCTLQRENTAMMSRSHGRGPRPAAIAKKWAALEPLVHDAEALR